MLLGLSRFVTAFFFFCKGKTADSAVGLNSECSRFRGAFVLIKGKYDTKTLASA